MTNGGEAQSVGKKLAATPVSKMAFPSHYISTANNEGGSAKPDCDEKSSSTAAVPLGLSYRWRGENDIRSPFHLILELVCRAPSQKQLIVEYQSICSGYHMLNEKIIEVNIKLKGAAEIHIEGRSSKKPVAGDSAAVPVAATLSERTSELVTESRYDEEPAHTANCEMEESAQDNEPAHLQDPRQLEDKAVYKNIDEQYFLFVNSLWFKSLTPEQYKATNDLHRFLASEYYDLTIVALHPQSSSCLKTFSRSHGIDESQWQRCIYSQLEMLRSRLPESLEHLETFMYYIYGLLGSLQEIQGADRQVWIEAQGDLAHFRYVKHPNYKSFIDKSIN